MTAKPAALTAHRWKLMPYTVSDHDILAFREVAAWALEARALLRGAPCTCKTAGIHAPTCYTKRAEALAADAPEEKP